MKLLIWPHFKKKQPSEIFTLNFFDHILLVILFYPWTFFGLKFILERTYPTGKQKDLNEKSEAIITGIKGTEPNVPLEPKDLREGKGTRDIKTSEIKSLYNKNL